MSTLSNAITPDVEKQLETIRARHQVRPVTPGEEGAPAGALGERVYGFTYSPSNDSAPLFAKRTFQCFEVHKVSRDALQLICFVTPAEAETIQSGRGLDQAKLYPEPTGASTALIEIPFTRILHPKPLSRSDGNFMAVQLDPE